VKAEQHFDRALELNPNSLDAYHCKSIYLLCPLGRLEEAVECHELALAIDPLSRPVLANLALELDCLHREEAEAQVLDRLNLLDPSFVGGQWILVRFRARQGRIAEAVEWAERLVHTAGRWGMTLGALGAAYAAAGRVDAAREVIAELGLDHNRESRAFYSFLIAAALDDRDAAFRWAAESIKHRDPIMLSFLWSSSFDALRDDPRFAGLLKILKIEHRSLASASRVV
jgi:tetratricopeptide (TPR) repeat protein